MHRKRSASASVQHDAREHNPASSSFLLPRDVFAPLERPPFPPSLLPYPPFLSRRQASVAWRGGAVRQSGSLLALSIPVGSAWRGGARSGATRRGVQRCVGRCWGVRRRKEGNRREGGTETILSLFHVSPSPFLSLPFSLPSNPLSLPSSPSHSHQPSFLRHGIERGAIPLERRQRPGGACAPRRGSGRLIVAKLEGEGEGAPPCSIPRSSSVHPTIGCRAAPLPPLATAPLPGPPRSPHSVLGITACSIELDARRRKERDNDHLPLCAPRIIYRSLSLFNLSPFTDPFGSHLHRCTRCREKRAGRRRG